MTQEQTKALFDKASDNAINYKDDTEVISISSAFIIINKIYDELETKSCEGCIHHKAYHGNFALSCCECSRFYSDNFEEIKK